MKRILPGIIALYTLFLAPARIEAAVFYLQATGHPTVLSSWNSQPDGSGSIPSRFNSANDNWVFQTSGTRLAETLTVPFGAHSNATLTVGNGFHLTVTGGGKSGAKYNIAPTGSLTVDNNALFKLNVLDVTSTVIYGINSSSVFPVWSGLSYGNLQVSKSTFLSGTAIRVAGALIIDASRTLSLNSVPLIMTGLGATMFSGTGTIFGTSSSTLTLSGGNGGNNGTLNMAVAGSTLNTLNLQFGSAADHVLLGTDLTVNNNFSHTGGGIDLNGNDLFLNGNLSLPASNASAGFFGNTTSLLRISATSVTGDLQFNSGANNLGSLVLAGGNLTVGSPLVIIDSVSVHSGVLNSNSNIELNSDASGKARLGYVGGTFAGDAIVETLISGGSTGWMHMGVNGVLNQTVADWDTYASSGGTNGIPMTCVGCTYPPTITTPSFHSIQGWDEANDTYDQTITASTPLTPGRGFWVYVGNGASTTTDLTLINTGPLMQGVQSFALSGQGTDGFNLVANMYPSPVSWTRVHGWTQLVHNGSVNAEIHIFSPDNGYASYVAGAGSGVNGGSDVLPMGQGFYVSVNSNTAGLIFNEDVKLPDHSTELLRTSKGTKKEYTYFKLMIDGAWGRDETMFNFERKASTNFDRLYDAHKMFHSAGYAGYGDSYSKYTTLSSKDAEGVDYSIHSLPPLTSSLSIPLLARVMVSGSHTISINESENYDGCLVLHDKLTGDFHDLTAAPYVFDISDTTSTPRFELMLCKMESGPVLSVDELQDNSRIVISQNADGAFVRTHFKSHTKATISAFNIVGQQLMKDMPVEGTETFTHLPINLKNQIVIIRVTTGEETQVKKVILH